MIAYRIYIIVEVLPQFSTYAFNCPHAQLRVHTYGGGRMPPHSRHAKLVRVTSMKVVQNVSVEKELY